jgi:hypothetical protein
MPVKKKKAKRKAVKKKTIKRKPAKKIIKKRIIKKRPAKKKQAAVVREKGLEKEKIIGTVTHYFPHVRAAVVKLKTGFSVGDSVRIKGHTTDFTQKVTSIQIDRVPITTGKKGDEIGLLVNSRVRQHDVVYKA